MADWQEIIHDNHENNHSDDGYELVTMPPADEAAILELEKTLGIEFPYEFHEMYQVCDGFGLTTEGHDRVSWNFYPLAMIPAFVVFVRSFFEETHSDIARRFFPFHDWGNGDASGYFTSESGYVLSGFYKYDHERYRYDSSQDHNEFIDSVYDSVEDFLT